MDWERPMVALVSRPSFSDNGIGDILINAKYNLLPTLSSMVVLGFGMYLPTGDHDQKTAGLEAAMRRWNRPAQLGRGQVGLERSIYQTYEIIPHRLNQFASASYRHTFRNNFGYQFGDQFMWDSARISSQFPGWC